MKVLLRWSDLQEPTLFIRFILDKREELGVLKGGGIQTVTSLAG